MSLIETLMQEMNQIGQEQKKNTTMKAMIQQANEQLKSYKATQTQQRNEQFPLLLLMKIIMMLDSRSTSQMMLGISIIQKLFTMNLVRREEQLPILQFLYQTKETIDEQLQLKLVQSTLQLLSLADLKEQEQYERLFSILFSLVVSRNSITQNTSMTGLFQLTSILYQEYVESPETYSKQACSIFLELIKGMQGQKIPWIQQNVQTKGVCRDLLLGIIKQLGSRITQNEHLMKYVVDYISPVIYEEIGIDSNDLHFNARRIRGAFRMIECVHKDISLVKHLSILYNKVHEYHYLRYWILEGINGLFLREDLVLLLANQEGGHFTYLQHLVQVVKVSCEQESKQGANSTISFMKNIKFIDTNVEFTEPPSYSEIQFRKLEIECTLALSETILALAKQMGINLSQKQAHGEMETLVLSIWVLVLKILKSLMKQVSDERLVQVLLNIIQIWVNVTASLAILKARDAFLKYLAQLCLEDKAIQSSKILFNVAHCLGNLLDVNSWNTILKTMQQFETLLLRNNSHIDSQTLNQEIQILQSVMDGLFSQSFQYEDQQLLQIIDALNQVTLDLMENLSIGGLKDTKGLQFGLQKINAICKVNWHRIESFWEFVGTHYNCIVNSRHKVFRELAIDHFSQILQHGFSYFQKAYSPKHLDDEELSPALHTKKHKWNRSSWQASLLFPLQEMVKVKYGEVKEVVLQTLFKLIQNNGHEINQLGFISMIDVLKLCSQLETDSYSYVNVGFHILEQLISQYMPIIGLNKDLLPLIKSYRLRSQEQNTSFKSVGMIWQLADNLSKWDQQDMQELWFEVLMSLKDLCLDPAPDVRQSALHIIVQISLINCSNFDQSFQLKLFENLHLSILDDLVGRVCQLLKLNAIFHVQTPKFMQNTPKFTKFRDEELDFQSQQQQISEWEETLKFFVQNFSKIIKKVIKYDDFCNDVFLRLFIMFRINNVDLKYEIIKIVRENCEETKMVWINEFIKALDDHLFSKNLDTRDQKILVSKVFHEVCQTFNQILLAYHKKIIEQNEELIEKIFTIYQTLLDQSSQVKVWMDDKQLHEYILDYAAIPDAKIELNSLKFLVTNIHRPSYFANFSRLVCAQEYKDSHSQLEEHQKLISTALVVSREMLLAKQEKKIPCVQEILKLVDNYEEKKYEYFKDVLVAIDWQDDGMNQDAIRRSVDVDIQIAEYLLGKEDLHPLLISYWSSLTSGSYSHEQLFYETRRRFLSLIFKSLIKEIVQLTLEQFIKDETIQGSMPLPRKQVQECVFILNELHNQPAQILVSFFDTFTELIATKEQEIKFHLQAVFKQIGSYIK